MAEDEATGSRKARVGLLSGVDSCHTAATQLLGSCLWAPMQAVPKVMLRAAPQSWLGPRNLCWAACASCSTGEASFRMPFTA